mgnify:CR=1 FL=1
MSNKENKSKKILVNQAGRPGPRNKAELQTLIDIYKEQNPIKWELKKEVLLKKLESLPD